MIGDDAGNGKSFYINTTKLSYFKYRDRPAVGLLVPPLPPREFWQCKSYRAILNPPQEKAS